MPSEARFIVEVIENQTSVVVITASSVPPATITDALKDVSARFSGSSVKPAVSGLFPIGGNASVGYVLGTAGLLEFATPPTAPVLKEAQEAIKNALVARHFGIYAES